MTDTNKTVNFDYADCFAPSSIGGGFNAGVVQAANNGQVSNAILLACLVENVNIKFNEKPSFFIQELNQLLSEKAPKSEVKSALLACYNMALAIIASGKVKSLPALSALPAWLDAEIIQKAKADKAAKAKATREANKQKAGAVSAPKIVEKIMPLDFSIVMAFIRDGVEHGDFDSTELSDLNALVQRGLKALVKAKQAA